MKISNEVKVGFFALVVLAGSIWGYYFLKGKNIIKPIKTVHAHYKLVPGLTTSQPVRVQGFQVGTIREINPIKDASGDGIMFDVVFDVADNFPIPKDAVAVISEEGFLGGVYINLLFDKPCSSDNCLESGDVLKSTSSSYITGILEKVGETLNADSIKIMADSLMSGVTSNREINQTLNDLQATLKSANLAMLEISKMVANSSKGLTGTVNNMNSISGKLDKSYSEIDGILANTKAVTAQLKAANLDQTSVAATEALQNLKTTLTSVQTSLKGVNEVVDKIDNGEGTLGLLMNERKVHDNMNDAISSLDLLLQDLRLNPKRYVHISVFGKKQKEYAFPENHPANHVYRSQ